ncbi:4-phosphopantetheinyl transferase, partial [Clavibacter phaseoli]
SVAHAGALVVVAVSACGPIGVDAEPRGREAPPGTPLGEWVRIEAVLKADGRGLRVEPSLVHFEDDGHGTVGWIDDEPARYRVVDADLGPGLVTAVARRGLGELDVRIPSPAGPGSDV